MEIVGLDNETCPFGSGEMVPQVVCTSWHVQGDDAPHIAAMPDGRIEGIIRDNIVVGHKIDYDMAGLLAWGHVSSETIWTAYDEGRILDTGVVQRLGEIGGGARLGWSLADLHRSLGLGELSKGAVRTDYGGLLGAPLTEYSDEHLRYALADATASLRVFLRLIQRYPSVKLPDIAAMTRKMWALSLMSAWGIETDPARVETLLRLTAEHVADLREQVADVGFVWYDPRAEEGRRWKRRTAEIKAQVLRAYGCEPDIAREYYVRDPERLKRVALRGWTEPDGRYIACPKSGRSTDAEKTAVRAAAKALVTSCPITPTGGVGTSGWVLRESGDPLLQVFADYGECSAVLSKDRQFLIKPIVHTRHTLADTLRTISSGPNLLNLRKKAGVRECFRARVGKAIVATDWRQGEVVCLAQVLIWLLGDWELADRVKAHIDDHNLTSAVALSIPYEEACRLKEAEDKAFNVIRQCAKIENFGKPGGMGPDTMMRQARAIYSVSKPIQFWIDLDAAWQRSHRSVVRFLRESIRKLIDPGGKTYSGRIPGTTVVRRGMTYCSAANMHFQGLLAVIAGRVAYNLAREQYHETGSALFGSRTLLHPHDEFLVECDIDRVDDVAARLDWHMTQHPDVRELLPDVPIETKSVAMVHWAKEARAIYAEGRLVPCCSHCAGEGCQLCQGTGRHYVTD